MLFPSFMTAIQASPTNSITKRYVQLGVISFYFSDVWSGSFSGLAFLYLNLLSLLARGGRNVQTLEKDTLWQLNFLL